MDDSILLVVHPNYTANKELIPKKYGNYQQYISELKSAIWSRPSLIFLYRNHKLPFELPENAEIISDREGNCFIGELYARLKSKNSPKVDICGEFLYYHAPEVSENLKKYAEKLNPEKRTQFEKTLEGLAVLDSVKFAKKLGFNPQQFTEDIFFTASELKEGCVMYVYNELETDFETRIVRELCFPTLDP